MKKEKPINTECYSCKRLEQNGGECAGKKVKGSGFANAPCLAFKEK